VQHGQQKQKSAMLTRDSLGTPFGEAKSLHQRICLSTLVHTILPLCDPSLIPIATDRNQPSTCMISCVNKPTSFAGSRSACVTV